MATAAQIRAQQLAAQQKAAAAKAAADKAAAAKAAQQAAAAKAAADKAQYAVSERQMNTDARGILKAAKAQAAAATKPPLNPATTGGPKPSPEAMLADKIKGVAQQYGDVKPPPPSLNPKPQIDQGYGNGVGYDGKPLYPDLRSSINPALNANPIAAGVARGAANIPANVPPGKKVFKRGGKIKSSYSSGGGVKSSASKRGDGIAQRGKTKGRMV